MSDIFISYSSKDRNYARKFAENFQSQGWTVWWDHHIATGEVFDQVIEKELAAAKCVVVLWTANSIESKWVRKEAAEADRKGKIVPILLDEVEIPLAFKDIQAANLVGKSNSIDAESYKVLLSHIAGKIGSELKLEQLPRKKPKMYVWASAVVVISISIFAFAYFKNPNPDIGKLVDPDTTIIKSEPKTFLVQCNSPDIKLKMTKRLKEDQLQNKNHEPDFLITIFTEPHSKVNYTSPSESTSMSNFRYTDFYYDSSALKVAINQDTFLFREFQIPETTPVENNDLAIVEYTTNVEQYFSTNFDAIYEKIEKYLLK